MEQIGESAFQESGSKSIEIPSFLRVPLEMDDCASRRWMDDCGCFDLDRGCALLGDVECLFINDKYMMNAADYKEIRLICHGHGREVVVYEHKGTGVLVALKNKMFDVSEPEHGPSLPRDIAVPHKLDLPGIVKVIGIRLAGSGTRDRHGAMTIMTELMPNGALEVLLKSKHTGRPTPGFGPTEESKAVFGIASTMAQIHKRSVIHLNLKPSKVLFDANWEVRIGGFDLSDVVAPGRKMTMGIGTPYFMAPELHGDDDDTYSFAVDVYAFGVLLYQFFTNKMDFEGMERQPKSALTIMSAVVRGQRFKRPSGVPDPFWDLITRCWAQSPDDRPSFEEIVGLMLGSNDFTFPGTDLEKYNEYRQKEFRLLTATGGSNSKPSDKDTLWLDLWDWRCLVG
jgi:serine/threonine protein kinase